MELQIDLSKSVEENAALYFEKSKKAKKKLQGLLKAIALTEEKLKKAVEKKPPEEKPLAKKRKRQWFQAFHWFRTSDRFLVVAGKSAKSNEALVKKHLLEEDMFLHAEVQGGAACVVKANGRKISSNALQEAAQFAAALSKAWQLGLPAVDVYAVAGPQVSKTAPAGATLATGSFMVYGKRQWFRKTRLCFVVGLVKERSQLLVMGGPPNAVKKHAIATVELVQGKEDKHAIAKKVLAFFEKKAVKKQPISLEEVVAELPSTGMAIKER